MDEVVLIRSLDGCMDFLDGSPLVSTPVPVRFLSFFFDFFLVSILDRFWDPAGTPKSTKKRPLAENEVTGTGVLSIFQPILFFSGFFIGFLVDFQ